MAPGASSRRLRPDRAWLLAILAVGALPRLSGLDFGFPGLFRPDEEATVGPAQRLRLDDLNPHQFDYPTLYIYAVSLVLLLVRVGWNALELGGIRFEAFTELHHGAPPYVVARALTAVLGVAGLHAAYRLGRAAGGTRVGLLAAGLLAVNYVHVRDSHFATTDVALTLLMTHALGAQLGVLRRGRTRDYCWAGVLTGLAGSVKYTGLGLVVPLLLAHFLHRARGARASATGGLGRLSLALGLLAAAFVATSPFVVLDFATAREMLSSSPPFVQIQQVYGAPPPVDASGVGWLLGLGLRYGCGPGIAALWLLALACVLWRTVRRGARRSATWLLLVGSQVAVLVPLVLSPAAFVRYILPLMPAMVVLVAAWTLVAVRRLVGSRRALVVAVSLLAAASLDPAVRALRTLRLMRLPDTRHEARLWIAENLPPRSALRAHPAHGINRPVLPHGYRYESLLDLPASGASWVLLEQAPVPAFTPRVPEELLQWIRAHGALAARFDPGSPSAQGTPVYDPSDAFYIPLAGHPAVRAAGPLLEIYFLDPARR